MNSYLFLEYMVCHLTISDVTGFVFLILFPVYEKKKKQHNFTSKTVNM